MSRPTLLAVGAHPDDLEIGAFGSLFRWRESYDIHLLLATQGEQGAGADVSPSRLEESEEAARLLGAELSCLDMPDGYVRDDLSTVQVLERTVRRLAPRRVLVNFPEDNHQDHRRLARAVLSATREVPEVLLYETPWTTGFRPSYFVDVTDTIECKQTCVAMHKSQDHRAYTSETHTLAVATVHALRLGLPGRYVEAFHVHRMVEL